MNWRLFMVYLLASTLLFGNLNPPRKSGGVAKLCPSRSEGLAKTFVCGDKKAIDSQSVRQFRELGLAHLFTPSGLHLTSAWLTLRSVFRFIKRRWPRQLIKILFFSSLYNLLTGYLSIRRLALFHICQTIFQLLNWRLPPFILFHCIFIYDFFWGSFTQSPLSFIYSYLFLGCFFTAKDKFSTPIIPLMAAQLWLAFFMDQKIVPLGMIIGLMLTPLFTPFFPPILLGGFLWPDLAEFVANIYGKIVQTSHELATISGKGQVDFMMVAIALMFSLRFPSRLFFLLIFVSPALG
jgi:competence protein ComEC